MIWLVFSRMIPSGAGNNRWSSINFVFATLELTEYQFPLLIFTQCLVNLWRISLRKYRIRIVISQIEQIIIIGGITCRGNFNLFRIGRSDLLKFL